MQLAAINRFHLVIKLWNDFMLSLLETIVEFFICKIPDDLDETSDSNPFCSLTPENVIRFYAPYILILFWALCCITLLMSVKYCSLRLCNPRSAKRYRIKMKRIAKIHAKSSSYFNLAGKTISLELESIYCIIWSLTGWKAMERNNSLITHHHST